MRKRIPLLITLALLGYAFWQSTDFATLAAGVAIFLLGMQFLEQGKIDTDVWITHRISFDEVPEKFAQFTDPKLGAIKAMIDIR